MRRTPRCSTTDGTSTAVTILIKLGLRSSPAPTRGKLDREGPATLQEREQPTRARAANALMRNGAEVQRHSATWRHRDGDCDWTGPASARTVFKIVVGINSFDNCVAGWTTRRLDDMEETPWT